MRRLVPLVLLAMSAACAPKPIPTPVVSAPKFPEFVAPVVPPSLAGGPVATSLDRGWRFLQAGDLQNARREFSIALRAAPAFYPAEVGMGYLELARREAAAAVSRFDRALEQQPRELSALVGRGQALLFLNREADALTAFEAALSVDASVGDVARQVDVLRFRRQQEDLNTARAAARAGRLDEAASLYGRAIAGSPDSAFLYRELAAVEAQAGDDVRALEHLRRAVSIEPGDASSLVQIGDILAARGDYDGAQATYAEALASEPNADVEAKLENVRARIELSRLPDEYRAIETIPDITRGDLAALIGVRLGFLLQATSRREAVLITDLRNHWAATWIVMAARAGVIEAFDNHAFQPATVVRRIDLAQVVSRLLDKLVEAAPSQPNAWQSAQVTFSDLAEGHLAYRAASVAVASGVMRMAPGDSFEPARSVSGLEAGETLGRVEAMARAAIGARKSAR